MEFADRRWPDLGQSAPAMDMHMDMHDDDDGYEPPLHPSEVGRRRFGRLLPGRRVTIAFALGIAATLAWQTWGNGPRQALADRFPRLAWLAPHGGAAAGPGSDGAAPSEQLTSITRSLAVVRQDVDRVSAEVAKLQAVKPETTALRTTASPPPASPAPPPASRKASPR